VLRDIVHRAFGGVYRIGDPFLAVEFGDRDFAAQGVEDDADLLLGRILLAGGWADICHERRGRISCVLDFCLMPTFQQVRMSSKSSVPQAASIVSQMSMSDSAA
jgi:hypothetical protein